VLLLKRGVKVIYQFLIDENWNNRTYRKIPEQTNTGVGNVNNIFNGLKQEGYLFQLTKQVYKIDKKQKLLDQWIIEYEKHLKPILVIGTFRFLHKDNVYNQKDIPLIKGKTIWGGTPAGDLLTHYLRS